MPNKWVDFIKSWAADNKMTYGCAMSDPKMKADYAMKYPSQPKTKKKAKEVETKQKGAASDLMAMANTAKENMAMGEEDKKEKVKIKVKKTQVVKTKVIGGKSYLMSADGRLYDEVTKKKVGKWEDGKATWL